MLKRDRCQERSEDSPFVRRQRAEGSIISPMMEVAEALQLYDKALKLERRCRRQKDEYNASKKAAAPPISPTAAAAQAAAAAALRPSSAGGSGSVSLEDQQAAQHPAARLAAALEHQQGLQRPQQSGLSAPPGRLAGNAIAAALHSRQSPAGPPPLRPPPRPPVPEAPLQQQQHMPASRNQDTTGIGGAAAVSGQEDVAVVHRLWLCAVCSWEGRIQAAALEHFQASRQHAPPCCADAVCCHVMYLFFVVGWLIGQLLRPTPLGTVLTKQCSCFCRAANIWRAASRPAAACVSTAASSSSTTGQCVWLLCMMHNVDVMLFTMV